MVNIPQTTNINVDKIKFDDDNPNNLHKDKYTALKKNIEKYGFIIPLITNEEYLLADGEHRLKAAKELGMTEVPVIALPVKDVDRRILRQVLNKLRGEHDGNLDLLEYKRILEEDGDLKELLAMNDKEFQRIQDALKPVEPEEYEVPDDVVVIQDDYLWILRQGLRSDYDILSGVTPPMARPDHVREVKFVEPVVNAIVVFDGEVVFNGDDCGYCYDKSKILPAMQFRSNAMIKREVHEKVKYESNLALHSFREETFFSVRAIVAGFKIGVDLNAKAYHLSSPSGGERSHASVREDSLHNEAMLNKLLVKHEKELTAYHKRIGKISVCVEKDTNLRLIK